MGAPRLLGKVAEGFVQCGGQVRIEIGMPRGLAEAPDGDGLQRALHDWPVQVVAAGHAAACLAEQQGLRGCGGGDEVTGRTEEIRHQTPRRQPDVLHRERRLLAVHGHEARDQGLLRHPAGNQGEVHGLLDIRREQQKTAAVRRLVIGLVATAYRGARSALGAAN